LTGSPDIYSQPTVLHDLPSATSTLPTLCVSKSNYPRCYVCELTVRGFWVVCSICGIGGHLEHMLAPDLELGHFCIGNVT